VDPAVNSSLFFTWTSASGTASNFPNSVGLVSSHATSVGFTFYGAAIGVAPGVARVDSYEAGYFIDEVVTLRRPIRAQVINQSFITDNPVDVFYDAYAATYNVLFVSGMNNAPDTPHSPGTAYNGIGVGNLVASGLSSVGPTTDGRAKPDIVAPDACCTSLSTPQVAGAARDTLEFCDAVAARELRSIVDNPVVLPDGRVESTGNFHGAPLGFAADFLAIAAAEVGAISERRVDRLLDVCRSRELPPFLTPDAGVNSGLMIAQYTAAGIVAENRRLAAPASVDSLPTSGMQEDHVSMGWAATKKLRTVLDNLTSILAVELVAAVRGIQLRAPLTPSEAGQVAATLSARGYNARSEGDLLLVQAEAPR